MLTLSSLRLISYSLIKSRASLTRLILILLRCWNDLTVKGGDTLESTLIGIINYRFPGVI